MIFNPPSGGFFYDINNIVSHNIKGGGQVFSWIKGRIAERTSWDAGVIIAGSLAVIFLGGIVKLAAYAGLAYGIWTLVKSED
jgi:hypothetical protein